MSDCDSVRECVRPLNALEASGGFTLYRTKRIRTGGPSLGLTLRLPIVSRSGIYFGAGFVSASESVFVDPVGVYVEPANGFQIRAGLHWALMALHSGRERSQTPEAEGLGGALGVFYFHRVHRFLRVGSAIRGVLLVAEDEDQHGHGLAPGFQASLVLDYSL